MILFVGLTVAGAFLVWVAGWFSRWVIRLFCGAFLAVTVLWILTAVETAFAVSRT